MKGLEEGEVLEGPWKGKGTGREKPRGRSFETETSGTKWLVKDGIDGVDTSWSISCFPFSHYSEQDGRTLVSRIICSPSKGREAQNPGHPGAQTKVVEVVDRVGKDYHLWMKRISFLSRVRRSSPLYEILTMSQLLTESCRRFQNFWLDYDSRPLVWLPILLYWCPFGLTLTVVHRKCWY